MTDNLAGDGFGQADAGDPVAGEEQSTRGGLPPLPTSLREPDDRQTPTPPPLEGMSGFKGFARGSDTQRAAPDARTAPRARGRMPSPDAPFDLASQDARVAVGAMPSAVASVSLNRKLWFYIAMVAPVVIGALYLFFITPDRYVTEFRFSVREPVSTQTASSSGAGPLAALFGGNPTPGSDLLDNYTITDYVRSEQAARDVDARLNLRRVFGKPADPIARLGAGVPFERLARYWHGMVYSDYDPASGLAVVRVQAFTPQDSLAIANALVSLSSDLVNEIGNRSQRDSLKFAEQEVARATGQVAKLRRELAGLRQSQNVIDPSSNTVPGNATLANSLRGNLSDLEQQIAIFSRQLQNPNAPQLAMLKHQLEVERAQLAQIEGQVGSGRSSLTGTVGEFEDVNTQMQAATQVLITNMTNLSQAQANVDSQRLYITTYVKPALPESSTSPSRWTALLLIAIGAAMVWLVGMLIGNSVLEHGW